MKRALISDIHGNLEALAAVLEDIRREGIDEIFCLGDIVGYGPNPAECLDIVMRVSKLTLLGNLDEAVLFDTDNLNPIAERSIGRTRLQLAQVGGLEAGKRRRRFLLDLPRSHSDGDYLFVHGSPREPTHEYVFPEDIYNPRKMEALFKLVTRYCFLGHTHIPGVITKKHEFISPEDCDDTVGLSGEPAIVNVGSVGQPRDNDERACYVILRDQSVRFRRVSYLRSVSWE